MSLERVPEPAVRRAPAGMACSLRDLFASMPEIDDLFAEVFDGPPGWISVAYDQQANAQRPASEAEVEFSWESPRQIIATCMRPNP